MTKKPKLMLISSRGGHLLQLYLLKSWWSGYDRVWLVAPGEDTADMLAGEKVYYGHFPETRNLLSAIKNFLMGARLAHTQKPTLAISCGAGIAPPVLLACRLLGIKTVFIDSVSFFDYPSVSAKICSLFVDKILTQHPKIIPQLNKSEWWGKVI